MLIWMIVAFIFILGPLLFLHELGHFWAAKRNGIPVQEFGFGLGPRVVKLFERDGTLYTIRAIPFAAFVRVAGEEDVSLESGLINAPHKAKLAVFASGPAFNIVAAVLLFWVAYLFGPPSLTRVAIEKVMPDSPAEAAGLLAGDVVLRADQLEITSNNDLREYIISHAGVPIDLLLERDGKELTLAVTPRLPGEFDPATDGPTGILMQTIDTGPAASQNIFQAGRSAGQDFVQIVSATVSWPANLVSAIQTRLENGDTGEPIPPEQDLRYMRPLGIVGILQLISLSLQTGIMAGYPFYIFQMAGLISIALGVTNLLPIPALDGGRIVFIILDWLSQTLFRHRINPEREIIIHAVGLMLLLALMVFITWQDIVNPLIQFPTKTPLP